MPGQSPPPPPPPRAGRSGAQLPFAGLQHPLRTLETVDPLRNTEE